MLSLLVPLAAADSGGLCAGCTIVVGLLLGRSKPVPIPPVALKAICAQKLSIAGIGDASGLCEAIASDPAAAELIAHHSQLAASGLPCQPPASQSDQLAVRRRPAASRGERAAPRARSEGE